MNNSTDKILWKKCLTLENVALEANQGDADNLSNKCGDTTVIIDDENMNENTSPEEGKTFFRPKPTRNCNEEYNSSQNF